LAVVFALETLFTVMFWTPARKKYGFACDLGNIP